MVGSRLHHLEHNASVSTYELSTRCVKAAVKGDVSVRSPSRLQAAELSPVRELLPQRARSLLQRVHGWPLPRYATQSRPSEWLRRLSQLAVFVCRGCEVDASDARGWWRSRPGCFFDPKFPSSHAAIFGIPSFTRTHGDVV